MSGKYKYQYDSYYESGFINIVIYFWVFENSIRVLEPNKILILYPEIFRFDSRFLRFGSIRFSSLTFRFDSRVLRFRFESIPVRDRFLRFGSIRFSILTFRIGSIPGIHFQRIVHSYCRFSVKKKVYSLK